MLAEPNRPQVITDILAALLAMGVNVSGRMLDDAIRSEPDFPLPPPVGVVGRSRVWGAQDVECALRPMAAWFAGSAERGAARAAATREAAKQQAAARAAQHEADVQRAIRQSRDAAQTRAWAQEQRRLREEADAKSRKERMDLGTRLVNQNAGSR